MSLTVPWTGLDFTLTFGVIDTLQDRRPVNLQGRPWDDPEVIARFTAHYRTDTNCFARYLQSRGLRRLDGSLKAAAGALQQAFE